MSGMKLSPDGLDIPVPFLNRLQDDQVVFFCGAGVSMRSGLPDFKGLVETLFSEFGAPLNERRYDYDRMLEELENNYSGVREKVRRILAPEGEVSARRLENHRNLLRLASVGGESGRVRLVTTNFDDRFLRAAKLRGLSIVPDDSPKLPMPEDGEEWASLVHLHGRILDDDRTLKSLVLTSSDFGRAYLIPGWARRFIAQLLREWHVAFVGYGLNDPPMRYLMDAAAAIRRRNPDSFRESYAFAPYRTGREEETRTEWKKKGITTPILYRKGRGIGAHSLLWKALGGLADLKENPLRSRENIALMDTEFMPEGDTKERVIWALENPATAQTFAARKFFPDTADGGKFVRWLDEFKKEGLFRADNAAPVDALDCPPRFTPNLPSPAKHLIDWVVRHTHQPSLLRWLAKLDGSLHPGLVRALHRAVIGKSGGEIDMPEELRELWGIFLQSHPVDSAGMELLDSQAYLAKNLPPNARLELSQRILSALRPLPVVVPEGPSVYARQSAGDFGVRVNVGCGLMRFWGRGDFILRKLGEGKNAIFALEEHAEALSAHLERALSIMAWREMPAGGLACLLPEADAAYRDYREGYWIFLARMVRNAVRKLVEAKKHRRLANLISRWAESEHPLLWRMALYAAAESAKHFSEFRDGGNWGAKILVEKCGALWGDECRPECLRFLRRAGGAIDSRELSKLERAIRNGPPEEFHSGSFDGPPKKTAAVRMAKLKLSEAKLSPLSEKFLAAARSEFPGVDFGGKVECRRLRSRMVGWKIVPQEDKLARIAPDMSPEQCADMIQKFREEGVGGFAFGLVERNPEQAVATYEALAARSVWDGVNWGDFLAALANRREIDDARAMRLLRMLDSAPDGFLADNVFNVALALENIAEFRPFSDMEKIWRRAWEFDPGDSPTISSDHHTSQLDIAINRAHGRLAEILLICFGQGKERNKLLGVLAEILASEEPSHKHGQILIGSRLSPLFHGCPEWARRHLLPFFAPEHPMAFGMWEAFLYHPTVSVELLAALKPGLMRFLKHIDDFHEHANNLVGVFVIGCLLHPEIIPRDEKRRMVAGMSSKGIRHLCWHMERDLWDGDGAALAKTWRELVFPFLREVWPEKRPTAGEASDISRALASVVILTGDAFPEAFQWAKDFLSPIAAGHAHQVMDFFYGHQEQAENIPDQFPRECLLFLNRIVPDKEFHDRDELDIVLDKIQQAAPELEKRPEFRRLREIASGG